MEMSGGEGKFGFSREGRIGNDYAGKKRNSFYFHGLRAQLIYMNGPENALFRGGNYRRAGFIRGRGFFSEWLWCTKGSLRQERIDRRTDSCEMELKMFVMF